MTGKLEKRFGFKTTKLTRPLIISGLVEIARERTSLIHDITTLTEMLTFVRNEKGRPEAKEGAHDDMIMSLAIAYYIRDQQSFVPNIEKTEENQDFYDDIYGARSLNSYFD